MIETFRSDFKCFNVKFYISVTYSFLGNSPASEI